MVFRVDGSFKSGKSLIADEVFSALFDTPYSGFRNAPLSIQRQQHDGEDVMVGFVNGDYGWYERKRNSSDMAHKGGIEFCKI